MLTPRQVALATRRGQVLQSRIVTQSVCPSGGMQVSVERRVVNAEAAGDLLQGAAVLEMGVGVADEREESSRDQESPSNSQATRPGPSGPPSPFGLPWIAQMTGAAFRSSSQGLRHHGHAGHERSCGSNSQGARDEQPFTLRRERPRPCRDPMGSPSPWSHPPVR